MNRRELLAAGLGGATLGVGLTASNSLAPVLFISHGAPTLAIQPEKGKALRRLAPLLESSKGILVLSAHWPTPKPRLGTTKAGALHYDFRGFPPALSQVKYPAPGAPKLAEEVKKLVSVEQTPRRLWDHGVWTPLVHLAPSAKVPLLQLSLPSEFTPQQLYQLGAKLSPLRKKGIAIIGSGGVTHNLWKVSADGSPTPAWAQQFDLWVKEQLQNRGLDQLLNAKEVSKNYHLSHPTDEHWLPLVFAWGAAGGEAGQFFNEGFEYGSLSLRSVLWNT